MKFQIKVYRVIFSFLNYLLLYIDFILVYKNESYINKHKLQFDTFYDWKII